MYGRGSECVYECVSVSVSEVCVRVGVSECGCE